MPKPIDSCLMPREPEIAVLQHWIDQSEGIPSAGRHSLIDVEIEQDTISPNGAIQRFFQQLL